MNDVLPMSSCYNRFQVLLEEVGRKNDIEQISAEESNQQLKSGKKSSKIKCFQTVQMQSGCSLPVKNCEKVGGKSVEINDLMLTPKSLLKKCRWCTFKKRSCALDRTRCTASDKKCYICCKMGHFPKSLNCKKRNFKRVIDFQNIIANYGSDNNVQYDVTEVQIKEKFEYIETLEDNVDTLGVFKNIKKKQYSSN